VVNLGPHGKHALIYEATRLIPRGRVAAYGWVAAWAGLPGHARLAGYALYNLPRELWSSVPWQRVINAAGRISYSEARGGHDFLQRQLLEKEGVVFDASGKVKLSVYGWHPTPE
jgi:methylated-DNA-protein-cysteine methyltransferase related protein